MLRLGAARPIGFIEPCQPTTGLKPPIGPGWLHEIKHDGYRLMALRTGERMRLLTRNGNDWSEFFPAVVEALKALEVRSCLIDGEVVVCDERGLAVFDLLRRGDRVKQCAHLYAFDLLEGEIDEDPTQWASPSTIRWSTHSRRTVPISRSAKQFCHGEPAEIGLSRMPMARRRRVTP
jgi:hypothetical protein